MNKIFNNNLPISFYDFTNDNLDKIHDELYQDALAKFIENKKKSNKNFDIDNYQIIEIKNQKNYLLPSSIILFNINNFERETISLEDYWNTNYKETQTPYKFNELLIDENNKKYIELSDIDYINGKIKFKNKFTNNEFSVDKSKIDFNIVYKNLLENTFGELVKQK